MNVEERVAALEKLLEKVRTNAAQPRPPRQRGPLFLASHDVAPPRNDAALPLPGIVDVSTAPPAAPPPKVTAPMEDLWTDNTTEAAAAPKLVALASPLPGAKDAAPVAPGTPKAPAISTTPKPATTTPAAKPTPTTPAAKPTPTTPAAKPAPTTTAAKPAPTTPAARPVAPTPATIGAKPALTPAPKPTPTAGPKATPVAATLPKPATTQPTAGMPKIGAPKAPEELKKTLHGVGDESPVAHDSAPPPDGRDSDAITAPLALNAEQIEMLLTERQTEHEKKTARPGKPEGEQLAEPDKKALEPAKTGLPSALDESADEQEEPTQLYGAAASSRRPDVLAEIEAKAAAAEPEKKAEPEVISLEADKLPEPPKPAAKSSEFDEISIAEELPEPDEKLVAQEEKPAAAAKSSEFDEISLAEALPEPEKQPALEVAAPEKQTEPKVEKPVETAATTKKPAPTKKPGTTPPASEAPVAEAEQKKGGMPAWLLVAALIVLAGAGAFVALKQGWIGGKPPAPPAPLDTGAAVTNPPPTAAPTPTTTAAAPAVPTATATLSPTAAPTESATAAPAETAAPAAPAKDPAKLPATKALLIVNTNKPAQVFLTGKLVGNTGEQIEVDCGPKFLRLAEPGEANPAKAKWVMPGQSSMVNCQKLNTITIP